MEPSWPRTLAAASPSLCARVRSDLSPRVVMAAVFDTLTGTDRTVTDDHVALTAVCDRAWLNGSEHRGGA